VRLVTHALSYKEDAMTLNTNFFRRAILSKLNQHLQENYSVSLPREGMRGDRSSLHQLDAALAFRSDGRLQELRSALSRLENGTFGICISCKREIPADTLSTDPAQRLCSECESRFSHAEVQRFEWPAAL
jgi:RNA polymerase-binding transcription factor DksA